MSDILDEIAQAVNARNAVQAQIEADNEALGGQVAALQGHVSTLQGQVTTLTQEVAAKDAEIDQLEQDLANCDQQGNHYPSGVPVPNTDLPGWRLIWNDDFPYTVPTGQFVAPPTSTSDAVVATGGKWGAYPNTYKDTSKNGIYTPEQTISVTNGTMKLRLFTDSTGQPRVAAPVPFIHGADKSKWPAQGGMAWSDQTFGRYAIRFRIPQPLPGYKIAWLLWPDVGGNTTGHPQGGGWGEIDFPETNLDVTTSVKGFVHYLNATVGNDQYASPTIPVDLSQWHTMVIEWSPNLVKFLLDGTVVGQTTTRVPNGPMHWVIQSETKIQTAKPPASTDGIIEIDWAAVWARA